jgi:hypothetical protein
MHKTAQQDLTEARFTLLGGPFYRLGSGLGLIRHGTNTFALGLALGLFLWSVLMLLGLAQGKASALFSLSLISGHARLLLVIPLFFLCESVFDPRCAEFVHSVLRSCVVPQESLPAMDTLIDKIRRCKDSWLPDAACLAAAILLSRAASQLNLFGVTATYDPNLGSATTLAGIWYWHICLTLFRFLLLRWAWRLCLWCYFLWCVSRLPLHLVPTHPDRCAGMGYLEVVHTHFTPLILAISIIQCASFAEEIAAGRLAFEAIYPALALTLIIDVTLFLGPLFIFSAKLWASRVQGLNEYMDFATDYVDSFDKKWLRARAVAGESLLGTSDLQSLADLGNSVEVINEMAWVPISKRILTYVAVAALLPVLPLFLFKYPAYEIAEKIFEHLLR